MSKKFETVQTIADFSSLVNKLAKHTIESSETSSAAYVYHYILNLYRWRQQLTDVSQFPFNNLKVYAKSESEHVVFVVVDTTEKFAAQVVWLYASESSETFEFLIQKLQCINWEIDVFFGAIHHTNSVAIRKLVSTLGHDIMEIDKCYTYYIPNEIVLQWNYSIPQGFSINPLTSADLNQLSEEWTYKHLRTDASIQLLLDHNGGFGLKNNNNELIGWVVLNEHMAIGMLRVIDKFQGNGYAKILVAHLCQTFIDEFELPPITFIVEDNVPSISLFNKIGFIKTGFTDWFISKYRGDT